jgi:hypothetical protein
MRSILSPVSRRDPSASPQDDTVRTVHSVILSGAKNLAGMCARSFACGSGRRNRCCHAEPMRSILSPVSRRDPSASPQDDTVRTVHSVILSGAKNLAGMCARSFGFASGRHGSREILHFVPDNANVPEHQTCSKRMRAMRGGGSTSACGTPAEGNSPHGSC